MWRQLQLAVTLAGLLTLSVGSAKAQISFDLPDVFVPVTADSDGVGEIVVRVVADPMSATPSLSGANVQFVANSLDVEFDTPELPGEDSLFAVDPTDFSPDAQTVQTGQSVFTTFPLVFADLEGEADNLITVPFTLSAGSAGQTVTLQFGSESALVDSAANALTIDILDTGSITGVLPGDFNGDLSVDAADYTVFRDTLGQTVTAFSGADGDGDGMVTAADYDVWVAAFGGAASSVAVPEPAGVVAVAAALLTALATRSRS